MSAQLKKKCFRLFFAVEVVVISFFYLFGAHGLPSLMHIRADQQVLQNEIDTLHVEISVLEEKIRLWHAYSFYTEQIAREHLHMARKGDQIYYLSTQKDQNT